MSMKMMQQVITLDAQVKVLTKRFETLLAAHLELQERLGRIEPLAHTHAVGQQARQPEKARS